MASEQILRIPRSDNREDYVLVNVSSNGSSLLDLRLLATEGESPYVLNIKQSCIQEFRVKASQLDEAQWERILHSILLRRPLFEVATETHSLEKLEVSATIGGGRLAIIVRKNISGITQRLGEIPLHKDDSHEIDSISWAATAVLRCTTIEEEMEDLRGKYKVQSQTVEKLSQQLEDLINAKIEHENALLEKFRDLLNAKKLKIRDQQRLLVSAKVDPRKAAQFQMGRSASISRSPISGTTKRKASHTPSANNSNSDNDEAFENMSIDQEDEVRQAATPERSDPSETEDEDDGDLDSVPVSQPAKESTVEKPNKESVVEPPPQTRSLPPRRDLPFSSHQSTNRVDGAQSPESRITASHGGAATGEAGDDDDDETSDDEL